MLFNSYEFIFVFLPVVLLVYFLLGKTSRRIALAWIVIASLAFYAWWRPQNVLIIGVSLLVNFSVATWICRLASDAKKAAITNLLLAVGIIFNICFLGYFKYVNFVRETLNVYAGTDFTLTHVILPLGISFITFQKIAFLVDVHAGRVDKFRFREFILFVLFFPQLIAGPIVHFREMMPQFKSNQYKFDAERVFAGLSLFVFGLSKKVILADGISAYVTPIYELAASGQAITLFQAWLAAVGFTLQMYFDFSGYSDMAAGLALCFGVKLPLNFDSPLKAKNIIDFWARWHITLTRFLTAYLYNPIALWLTRRRLSRGLPGFSTQSMNIGAFLQILAVPTLLTMTISGLWHGAGLLFILWGTIHGVYLVVNHVWRFLLPEREARSRKFKLLGAASGFLVTFLSVAVAMVLFRSTTADAAISILKGMVGLNGISLPPRILELTSTGHIFATMSMSATEFILAYCWTFGLLIIALLIPNATEIMTRYQPTLEPKTINCKWWPQFLIWRPTLAWTIFLCTLVVVAILRMSSHSEFLYWQF